jgi:hypothetical protein
LPELLEKTREVAMAGDTTALKLLLDRLAPIPKAPYPKTTPPARKALTKNKIKLLTDHRFALAHNFPANIRPGRILKDTTDGHISLLC